jgi:hypothetical protein
MNNIETAYVNSFREGFAHAFQQKGSRIRPHVTVVSQSSEFDFYDRLGKADDVNEVTVRYGDTPMNEVGHDRRRIGLRDFDWAKLVDPKDLIRTLTDPSSQYTQAAVWSFGRKVDEVLVNAAFGKAYLGKSGENLIDFVAPNATPAGVTKGNGTSTEGLDVGVSFGTANSNLTIAKLLAVRFNMLSTEAIEQGSLINAFVTSSQLWALLEDPKVQSVDYNTVRALAQGQITEYAGFRFIHTELLPKVGNIRQCLFCLPSGINLALGKDLTVDVGPRRDKRNIPQIYIKMAFNASRMWGEQVARVNCQEA